MSDDSSLDVWETLLDEGAAEVVGGGGRLELPADTSFVDRVIARDRARAAAGMARLVGRIADEPDRTEWPRLGASGLGNPKLLGAVMDMQDAVMAAAVALHELSAKRPPLHWYELADLLDAMVDKLVEETPIG